MSEPFVVFSKITGEILRGGMVSEPVDLATQNRVETEDWLWQEGNDSLHYVDLETLTIIDRPELDFATDITIAVGEPLVVPLPNDSIVVLNRIQKVVVDDGHVEFTPVSPGFNTLDVKPPFPLKPRQMRISVVE